LGVNPSLPVRNVQELIAYLKDHPGQIFYGSSGTGGSDHLAGDLFMKETGTKIIHVPYKGGALALRDLVAGNTQMQFMTIPAAIPLIRDGRIRPLALLSNKRFELFPDVPTIAEAGLKDVYVNNTYGVTVPAGTPPDVIHKLNAELVRAVKNPEVVNRFKDLGLVPMYNTPAEFTQFMKDEYDRWAQIVQVSGASVD
jgi:tripartite-type tricarboxylate transporter receptor subunit TctC